MNFTSYNALAIYSRNRHINTQTFNKSGKPSHWHVKDILVTRSPKVKHEDSESVVSSSSASLVTVILAALSLRGVPKRIRAISPNEEKPWIINVQRYNSVAQRHIICQLNAWLSVQRRNSGVKIKVEFYFIIVNYFTIQEWLQIFKKGGKEKEC